MTTKPLSRFKRLAIAGAVTTALASVALYCLPQNAVAVSEPVGAVETPA